jgi:hypothetical protein
MATITALKIRGKRGRTLDALPDAPDFRDAVFQPTLIEVPTKRTLAQYRRARVPVLDQGKEGACTGFALATVVHYLLRTRRVVPERGRVSPHMLYAMAKRYDEWPGEAYDGSSARGAMKAWHKHGVCAERLWRARAGVALSHRIVEDAIRRPLGAYYRVNHTDLVAMHCATAEVGALYATGVVHEGWLSVKQTGVIRPGGAVLRGHAFVIVGYDDEGFWIQNSWGRGWGHGGFGLLRYEDWLAHGTDVWVARLGVPLAIVAGVPAVDVSARAGSTPDSSVFRDLRPHVVSIGNNGVLQTTGMFGTTPAEVSEILSSDFPRITKGWRVKRLLLYAHGGLVSEKTALQRIAGYRPQLLENQVYPLAFIWHTDYWSTMAAMIKEALQHRRTEGILDAAKDFMLDRLDDLLEPVARALTGKAEWDEMKENGIAATVSGNGGARIVAECLRGLLKSEPALELHVAGHSAGSIFMAPLIQLLTAKGRIAGAPWTPATGLGQTVASCTLWAPACTMKLFQQSYLPALIDQRIRRFALFTLRDNVEQDDNCAGIYHKSLLYLVSNAFEEAFRIPIIHPDGEMLLGMAKWVEQDRPLQGILQRPGNCWVQSPNDVPEGQAGASRALHHGDFDDDSPTVAATLANILNLPSLARAPTPTTRFRFDHSASSRRDRRLMVERASGGGA